MHRRARVVSRLPSDVFIDCCDCQEVFNICVRIRPPTIDSKIEDRLNDNPHDSVLSEVLSHLDSDTVSMSIQRRVVAIVP